MKHLISVVICLIVALSNVTLAQNKVNPVTKPLMIDLNLSINNKPVQKSKIITRFGQSASVAQLLDTKTGSYIEVVPNYNENKELVMQFKIAKIVDNEKKLLSKPVITTKLGQKAQVTTSDKDKNTITLAVLTEQENFA